MKAAYKIKISEEIKADLPKESGVYKITSPSGGFYIGSTKSFRKRCKEHAEALKKGVHHSLPLQRAAKKYGLDNLIFEVIAMLPIEEARREEQRFLDELRPVYNVSKIVGLPSVEHLKDPEYIKRLVEVGKNSLQAIRDDEELSRIRKVRAAEGIKKYYENISSQEKDRAIARSIKSIKTAHAPECRAKAMASRKANRASIKSLMRTIHGVQVVRMSDGKKFNSIAEAAENTINTTEKTISRALRIGYKTGESYWRYGDETDRERILRIAKNINFEEDSRKASQAHAHAERHKKRQEQYKARDEERKIAGLPPLRRSIGRPVIRMSDGVEFLTSVLASEQTPGTSRSTIAVALKLGYSAGGSKWRYADESEEQWTVRTLKNFEATRVDRVAANKAACLQRGEKYKQQTIERRKNGFEKRCVGSKGRPIIRMIDGYLYPSATAAAMENGVSRSAITNAVARGHNVAGSKWQYADVVNRF